MHKHAKLSMLIVLAAALILIPFIHETLAQEPSLDEGYSAEKMTVDILLIRPVGIAATAFGTAIFVVSLPFSLLGGNTGAAFENLMAEPAKFTFARPLGDL